VQRFSEMSVLIVVIVSFLVVGVLSSRVISIALRRLFDAASTLGASGGNARSAEIRDLVRDANTQGKELRVRVVVTIAFIFLTVLLRATVSVLYAVAQSLQDYDNPCSDNPCSPCRNVYSNMQGWIIYTPEYVQQQKNFQQRTHTITRFLRSVTPLPAGSSSSACSSHRLSRCLSLYGACRAARWMPTQLSPPPLRVPWV
jgi:hypothetical protein